MKKTFLLFCLITSLLSLNAQVKISGIVKTNKGKNLAAVSITLKNTYDGAITDNEGKFQFTSTEKGSFQLEASMSGYKTVSLPITLRDSSISQNFILKEEITELKAVVVTAGSFAAGDKKKGVVLNSLDIVTTASANGDVTAAVKTLPGAQQVGEQEGLFVRGGAGYETKQFIDGSFVSNPYNASVPDIASRGRFSPFLFKGTVFSTGGYSALYGQALSSALILESIDLPERSEIDASISSVFIGGGTQHLAKNKKSSWGVNYGYTNLLPYFAIVKQKPDYFAIPQFHTAESNIRFKIKNGGMIKFYTSISTSDLGLRRPNIDSSLLKNAYGINNFNWYNNFSLRTNIGNGWKLNLSASYSTNKDNITSSIQNQQNEKVTTNLSYIDNNNFYLNNRADVSQIKTVFDKKLSGINILRFGSEYWYSYTKTKFNSYDALLVDHYAAVFAETDVYITNGLAAKIGARFEHSSIINKNNIAPRLSLAYKTGKDAQMSLAYGLFYQKPENSWQQAANIEGSNLDYTQAAHYIINYQKMNSLYTFRVEAFYKKYNSLVKSIPNYNNTGDGYAQGIELFWRDKKTFKNVDYWFSYSYLDTKRNYLYYPKPLQPNFAANHTASLVAKRFVLPWRTGFNFTYTYATGRPYYYISSNGTTSEIKDQGKTIDYNALSFSLNYLPHLGKKNKKSFVVLVASITNVLNQNQVYGYNYSHDGAIKLPINPPSKQFFFLGCFLSWGVDRSQDAINNNL